MRRSRPLCSIAASLALSAATRWTRSLTRGNKKKRPDCEIQVYDEADHGFHCDERGSYQAESAKIAWGRTTAFLEKNIMS